MKPDQSCGIIFAMRNRVYSKLAFGLFLSLPALAGDSAVVVDRGLPQANLNNVSGPQRSNVRWGWQDEGFLGDSFQIGAPGERWVIDSIRTWVVPGNSEHAHRFLGDFFKDVRLYLGADKDDLTPVSAAQLVPGSDEASNAAIRVSEATREGNLLYDDFGAKLRIWQVEFSGLNWTVEGGREQRFGVWGLGRNVPGSEGRTYTWYNHASNARLSVAQQDGADNKMILFNGSGRTQRDFNAEGNGWDKPADINVQVIAHRVDGNGRRVTVRR
jgi:hypothetical protein